MSIFSKGVSLEDGNNEMLSKSINELTENWFSKTGPFSDVIGNSWKRWNSPL